MTKIAYNACYGGFGLSLKAILRAREMSGDPKWADSTVPGELYEDGEMAEHTWCDCRRTDPVLIQVIEELGNEANGDGALLCIAEVPAGQRYRIDDYDGNESVMTPDDYEWEIA